MALPLHAIGLVLRLPDESFVFELFLCGKLGERFRAGAQNLSQRNSPQQHKKHGSHAQEGSLLSNFLFVVLQQAQQSRHEWTL